MTNPAVILTKCEEYKSETIAACIEKQFALQGGLEKFIRPGDKVLLKPNLIAPKPQCNATQTDPMIILETAKLLKDYGAKPFIGDSPAWSNIFECMRVLELEAPLKKLSIPVKQLNKRKTYHIGAKKNMSVGISSIAVDADAIINLPKFKSHQQLITTFAVKNMFGCVSGKRKAIWHFKKGKNAYKFCKFLINIYDFLNPVITIIDGVIAMDGPGPIHGRARKLGWLIGGTDPIACETVCAKLIGMEPMSLPIINTAAKMNFGCFDFNKIQILGDEFPENICTDFQPAEQIPIRFSFLRVCKSMSKQALLILSDMIHKKQINSNIEISQNE